MRPAVVRPADVRPAVVRAPVLSAAPVFEGAARAAASVTAVFFAAVLLPPAVPVAPPAAGASVPLFPAAFFAVLALETAAFLEEVFPAVVFPPEAAPDSLFTGLVPRPTGARVLFLPLTSWAAESVDLPDAECCAAVFLPTMAAAPSHIVTLHANRAGTINRLPARGNGAYCRSARPEGSGAQVCLRCAQQPGRYSDKRDVPGFEHPRPAIRGTPDTPSTPPLSRSSAPQNRSATVGPAPYTGRSEKHGWGRVASYAAQSDPGTVGARGASAT